MRVLPLTVWLAGLVPVLALGADGGAALPASERDAPAPGDGVTLAVDGGAADAPTTGAMEIESFEAAPAGAMTIEGFEPFDAGLAAAPVETFATRRASPPSGAMTYTCGSASSLRFAVKATWRPSGDHAGALLLPRKLPTRVRLLV